MSEARPVPLDLAARGELRDASVDWADVVAVCSPETGERPTRS